VDGRGRDLGPRRAAARPAAVAAPRRTLGTADRVRLHRRARGARGARAARDRAARPRRAGGEAALPPRRLASRRRGRRAGPGRGRPGGRGHGRRQPGLAHGRRSLRALGRRDRHPMRPRPRAARRLLARGAAADGRRRGLRAAAPSHVASHRCRRDGAKPVRGPRSHPARRRRRGATRRGACRRPWRLPADPPGWTPDRRDWLLGGPTIEIAPDGTIAPLPGPGLGVVPDLDRLEEHRVA
jgi:hypothetical protein